MAQVKLLDCTLRDGGYVNNWNFGKITIRSLISRLAYSGVDIIEVGFIDELAEYDANSSVYPDVQSIGKTLGSIDVGGAKLYVMIEYPRFPADKLIPQSEAKIDGLRISFKKGEMDKVMPLALKIKELGYELSLNPMALFSYTDTEILELITQINVLEPTLVAIADTYGVMFSRDAARYLYLFDYNLAKNIMLGFHSHNNMQMSNAMCIDFARNDTLRSLVLDASLLGMGKNAGNACTEIISAYLTKTGMKHFDFPTIIETAYTDIFRFQQVGNWGYDVKYLISAIEECSPNVVNYFMKLNTLAFSDMFKIIDTLPAERRIPSYFTAEIGRKSYEKFIQKTEEEQGLPFAQKLLSQEILLIGPGSSVVDENETIARFIEKKSPLVISLNHIPEKFAPDYVFVSNPRRYSLVIAQCADMDGVPPDFLITSNISPIKLRNTQYKLNLAPLLAKVGGDSSAGLCMAMLLSLGVKRVAVAGLDGFGTTYNFATSDFESGMYAKNEEPAKKNEELAEQLRKLQELEMNFITSSILTDRVLRVKT